MVSGWVDTVQTSDYINAVQTNNYGNVGDTLVFDGLTARAELRY